MDDLPCLGFLCHHESNHPLFQKCLQHFVHSSHVQSCINQFEAECLALLLCVWRVNGSVMDVETNYPDNFVALVFSVTLGHSFPHCVIDTTTGVYWYTILIKKSKYKTG